MSYSLNYEYLYIAYKLSLLTFYIGVLIYALPIPMPGIKKWGPILIQDGILAAVFVLVINLFFAAGDRIAQLVGGSWEFFRVWLSSSSSILITLKSILLIIESIPNVAGTLTGIKSVAKIADKMITSALIFQAFIAGLAWIVKNLSGFLASIGAILYAMPFRIARSAGAWIIAFLVVFSAGLQALPVFLQAAAGNSSFSGFGPIADYGIAMANISVEALEGRAYTGILHVQLYDSGKEIARYIVRDGYARGKYSDEGVLVPSKTKIVYDYEYLGVSFNMVPYPTFPSNYTVIGGLWLLNLSNPFLIYSGNGVLVFTSGSTREIYHDDNQLKIKIYLKTNDYIEVRYIKSCDVSLSVSPGSGSRVRGSWSWYNLSGSYDKFISSKDREYDVEIKFDCRGSGVPRASVKSYASIRKIAESFFGFNLIKMFILYYFTLPSLYLLMLYSIAFGLAKALGGRERLPLRVF